MRARFRVVVIMIFICLMTSQAIAAEKEISSSLVLSGGRSVAQNACLSPVVSANNPGFKCEESHTIYRIAYIYKFSPTWGVEVSGGDLGDANGVGTYTYLGSPVPATWQMKANGWTVAGISNISIGNSFSLFAKLGIVRAQLHEENYIYTGGTWLYRASFGGVPLNATETNALTYGVGFQVDLYKNIGIRVQYENFGQYDVYSYYGVSTPKKVSLTAISAGLALNF